MLYEAKTPEAYLSMLEEDWRKEKLLQVRAMILQLAPQLEEGIQYKMLAYKLDGHAVFQLNAQKNYVSLYVGNISKVERGAEPLQPFSLGKGCIRIKKSLDLNSTQLDIFIQEVLDTWKQGGDTDC
jgi:uncharacterized protein YdhG (YjbR/CyaY superfamily)